MERGSVLRGVANIPIPRGEEMNTVRYKILSRKYMKEVADKVGVAEHLRSIRKTSTIDDVVRYLRDIVTLQARGSKIVEIFVIHENPDMAKNIADTIANNYVDETLKWRQDTTSASTYFIDQELEVYKKQLLEAEEALVDAQEKGVFDSLGSADNSLINELAKLRTDRVEVELDLQAASSELQNARRLSTSDVTESYSSAFYIDPEITSLQAKLAGLQTQHSDLSMKYTTQWPEVKTLEAEILRTKEELNQAKTKFSTRQQDITARLQYWQDKVRTLQIQRSALADKISEYDRALQRLPRRELELARLRRDRAAAESTYSMLLQRRNESDLLQSSELRDMGRIAEVLDPAIVPDRPVKPNKKKIAVLALAMGMIIGFGSAFVLEYFDRSFRSVDEAANYLGIPVLAAIPRLITSESELREKKSRRVKIICMALASLVVLILIADIVSAELFTRDSLFLSIARSGLNYLRRLL
jgi:polysaccharide chain length determinant protein (PEP-CTERM system associated)